VNGIVRLNETCRALDRRVECRKGVRRGVSKRFVAHETAPSFVTLVNDLRCILLVLGFAREGKHVFGLSIGNFIDSEPFIRRTDQPRKMSLHVFDIIQLGGQRIVDIDYKDLPIGLAFIEEGHNAEDFDLLDLAREADLLADLADVQWIIVTLSFGLRVHDLRVLPGLGKGTVVPDVAMMGEAIPDETELALLDVLLDRVEGLLLGHFHLGVSPPWDLHNHVEDSSVLIVEERDVVPWRKDGTGV